MSMTIEEIKNTPELIDYFLDESLTANSRKKLHKRMDEICNLAIKALEQEHCEDAVSRQAVEDTIFSECSGNKLDIDFAKVLLLQRAIKALPPVTPQESKTGHWIPVSERLPEEGGDYLTTTSFDIGDEEPVREVYKNFFCILSKKWLYREHDEYVTAWMPLPEPYKEESEDV